MLNQIVEKTLEQTKSEVYFYGLLIVWLSWLFVYPLLTYAFKTRNTNWGRFWVVWGFSVVITGIVFVFITVSPESVLSLINKIKILFT